MTVDYNRDLPLNNEKSGVFIQLRELMTDEGLV